MTRAATTYRWNTSTAAEAFDQAAEFIHPLYLTVQDQVLRQLPFDSDAPFLLVDLGAGSGRLVERVLSQFPNARAALIDQSEPFLAIAERRLQRFGERVAFIKRRLQDDWLSALSPAFRGLSMSKPPPSAVNAIVSMSAIHHLDSNEKKTLFARCHDVLAPGGVFINGDEYRPESDADYLATLQWWAAQKDAAEMRGQVPESFRPVFEAWYDRNIRRFGEPKSSGDDCLETVDSQVANLSSTGFVRVEAVWAEKLWAVITARKP
jgi:tRNA (cmo5U34)-methyltransferase